MKKFYFLIFISFSLSAQIRAVVKDSITGQPIPYVNIWAEDETIGTISEIDGSFSLEIKEEKVLVFSALGYEIKKMSSKNEIILLTPKAFELNEVVIERPQFKKEIEIGENIQKKSIRITAIFSNLKGRYFPFQESYKETKFIKKVKIFTKSNIAAAKFKLRVLGVNKLGYPGNDLIDEEIIITVEKGKNENVINFEKYNFVFPENGIFIVFETLFLEENKSFYNQPNKKSKAVSYEPGLLYNLVDDQNSFIFTEKGWYKFPKQSVTPNQWDFRKFDNKVFEPAINLILTN